MGHTARRFQDCLHGHVYDIGEELGTNVARHFNGAYGGDTSLLQIQGIEKITTHRRGGDNFGIPCKREVFWIFSL